MKRFRDRNEAGEALAEAVARLGLANPAVLALPRGGVPVAEPVARRLEAPLDLLMARKIGAPGNPEFAVGAVTDGDDPRTAFNADTLLALGMAEVDFESAVAAELETIHARRKLYLKGRSPLALRGRDAVVVDDGLATGATAKVALAGLAERGPRTITLAVPVAPPEVAAEMRALVDNLVCLAEPEPFLAVGRHYVLFDQTADAEVVEILDRLSPESGKSGGAECR